MARSREDVGIWLETYLVRAGEYEAVYSGMPPFGLGKVRGLIPAAGRHATARDRVGKSVAEPAGVGESSQQGLTAAR
jgi:hypothetical protein